MPRRKQGDAGIPVAARCFDELPDSALVDINVIAITDGVSIATAWRRVKDGLLPKPEPKIPKTNATRWQVGKLRRCRAMRHATEAEAA